MTAISADVGPCWLVRNVEVWEDEVRLRYVTAVDIDEGWVEQYVVDRYDPGGGALFKRDAKGNRVTHRRVGLHLRLVDPATERTICETGDGDFRSAERGCS